MLQESSLQRPPRRETTSLTKSLDALPLLYPLVEAWNADQYRELLRFAQTSPDHHDALLERLSSEVGPDLATDLLDRSLFSQMRALHEHLSEGRYRELPYVDRELCVIDMLLLAKVFGSPDRVDALIDTHYPSSLDDQLLPKQQPLLFIDSHFSRTDGFRGRILLQVEAQSPDNGDADHAYQAISCVHVSHTEGAWSSYGELDRLELARELQAHGSGSRLFAQWLLWSLEQEVYAIPMESLQLKANIDVGGYAWALYGFDFDEAQWTSAPLPDQKEFMRRDALSLAERRREIMEHILVDRWHAVTGILREATQNGCELAASLRAYGEHCIAELRSLLDHDQTSSLVTPGSIAIIGLDQPKIQRTVDGDFYVGGAPEGATVERETHLGKLLLLGSQWHGQLPLSPSNPHENPALATAFRRLHIPL